MATCLLKLKKRLDNESPAPKVRVEYKELVVSVKLKVADEPEISQKAIAPIESKPVSATFLPKLDPCLLMQLLPANELKDSWIMSVSEQYRQTIENQNKRKSSLNDDKWL